MPRGDSNPDLMCAALTPHGTQETSDLTLFYNRHAVSNLFGYALLSSHPRLSHPCATHHLYLHLIFLCKSVKEQVCWWKRGDSNPLYMTNMHQSSVVIRASPIAPLPCAGLSRLSSQEPQSALCFSVIMFISFNLFSLLRTLTHSGAFGCMLWSTVHPLMCIAKF